MAGNTLQELLAKMKTGSITRGWGVMCAFKRERINRVLWQDWLDKYDGNYSMLPISGRMDLNNSKTEFGILKNLMVGKPRLSFEDSSLLNSEAWLTLNLLGGSFEVHADIDGLLYAFDISEDLGYTLRVKLKLGMISGNVDRRGKVTMDLSTGTEFVCDLVPAESQEKLGAFFQARFMELPRQLQVYVLGILDFKGNSDLIPKSFRVFTQPAPGSQKKGAKNTGDGAVIVGVRVKADTQEGTSPGSTFPWLFASDRDYTATMVVAEKYASRPHEETLKLIQSLLFPGLKNVFEEGLRETPKDLAIFGWLATSKTSLTIEPEFHAMQAGGAPVAYKAYLDGVQKNVTWSVMSLNSNTSAGEINAASGAYRPVTADNLGRDLVRNLVKASYEDPVTQVKHEVQSLLLVSSRAMAISPGVVSRVAGQTKKVHFVVTVPSGATVSWERPAHGTLVTSGNTAEYTPPPQSKRRKFDGFAAVDRIVARTDTGESVEAIVVLTKSPAKKVEPSFVNGLARTGTVSFTPPIRNDATVTEWGVIGDGDISATGEYRALASSTRNYDVVTCEQRYMGVLIGAGYSVVKLALHTEEAGWTDLDKFRLEVQGPDKGYANGYQTIQVMAYIETNGAPLTFEEERSLRIYYQGGQQVMDVPPGQEGIEPEDIPGPGALWGQMREPTRFSPMPGKRGNGTRRRKQGESEIDVFLVNRARAVTRFHAAFMDKNNNFWSSNEDDFPDGKISLNPQGVPEKDVGEYELRRTRMSGGGGSSDDDNDFDLYPDSSEKYTLSYKRGGQVPVVFEVAEVETIESIVQWESMAPNETMFTCCGYAYNDPEVEKDQNVMHFERSVLNELGDLISPIIPAGHGLARAQFAVGMYRLGHDKKIRQDKHPALHPFRLLPLRVRARDNEGNLHEISIFIQHDNRNKLLIEFSEEEERARGAITKKQTGKSKAKGKIKA